MTVLLCFIVLLLYVIVYLFIICYARFFLRIYLFNINFAIMSKFSNILQLFL